MNQAIGKKPTPWVEPSWMARAACIHEDPSLFFAEEWERKTDREEREARAKSICADCPVRAECGEYADARPEKYGTWGGLNEEEREEARKKRMRRQSYHRQLGARRAAGRVA